MTAPMTDVVPPAVRTAFDLLWNAAKQARLSHDEHAAVQQAVVTLNADLVACHTPPATAPEPTA